ncbi:MAG: DUF896 domain-containing protein [Lachnospiraceae bacterium]|nr:DUF896 domain-containing protein [Lachnospiraceae bacterium]
MDMKDIERINELYRKSKSTGLTPEEKEEQSRLRGEYIQAMKRNLSSQLDTIKIKNPDGSIIDVKKRHENNMAKAGKKPLA